MKIVLIGFMCSGKSKVGRTLAQKLGWTHYDTDEMISKQVGMSVADIIRKQGEPAFREIESSAVRLVAALDKCVISTGGGVPLSESNMKELRPSSEIVWLRVKPETVLTRAGKLESRPLIDSKDPLGSIRKRLAEREPAYAVAGHSVDTDQATPDQVADKIFSMLPALHK